MRLIVPARVERQPPEQLPVWGQHPDVASRDQQDHAPAIERPSHADVMELAPVADGHRAVLIDPVVSHPQLSRVGAIEFARLRLGARVKRRARRHAALGAVRADLVVIGDEAINLSLELGDRFCLGLFGQEPLEGLVETLDLAQVWGW